MSVSERIERLDLSLFAAIPSQTSTEDRRALLAVQRATARRFGTYVYLEIGSHLGGSIQPHLVDERCVAIYSIDPRPPQQPDDRAPGAVFRYDDNSSERMLRLLSGIPGGNVAKIECIESDASAVNPARIRRRPHVALIDGEHTQKAALSDFSFCHRVLAEGGVILFHDFGIVQEAVRKICRQLRRERPSAIGVRLDGSVFGIFYDPHLVECDPYLYAMRLKHRHFWLRQLAKHHLKRALPPSFWTWQWEVRARWRQRRRSP